MKKLLAFAIAAVMVLSMIPVMAITSSATDAPAIVKEGLVAWYDGSNNSNGAQDYTSAVWKDLSGNKNHMAVRLDETNRWTEKSFHIDATTNYFPTAVKDVINGNEYTFEFVAGELSYAATNWITIMCSDNDEFSLFVRVGDETNLEYKYNDENRDRPVADNGAELINNATVAVTFNLAESICTLYVDGVAVDTGVPEVANIADTLSFGHENAARAWSGDIHAFRFYNKALTAEEIAKNAEADDEKYRSENSYSPVKEYDDSDDGEVSGLEGDFKANVIPMLPALDLIPLDGYYGPQSVVSNFYAADGEWTGAKITPTDPIETDGSGNVYIPRFIVNYQKYCRLTGVTPLTAEDVDYIVLKLVVKAESGNIGDIKMTAMAGSARVERLGSVYGSAECSGETEYMLYNLSKADSTQWAGQIEMLRLELDYLTVGDEVYLEEIALFGTDQEAYDYMSDEEETEDTTAEETTAEETTAPETTVADTTVAATEELTTAGETVADVTAADTTASAEGTASAGTTAAAAEGCKSSVIGGGVALAVIALAGYTVCRKRNED